MTTFDDYIRCKGIKADAIYNSESAASAVGVHPVTLKRYMFDGRRTRRHGIVSLHYHITVKGCEIIGKDLIEFLRLTHRESES